MWEYPPDLQEIQNSANRWINKRKSDEDESMLQKKRSQKILIFVI